MNYKQFFFILIMGTLLLCYLPSKAQDVKLEKVQVNKSLRLSLPKDFMLMPEQEIRAKYISYRDPLAIYTNQSRTVDLGINLSVTHWEPNDLEIMQQFYENSIQALYTEVDFLKKDIESVDGIRFAVFEFISTVIDEESIVNRSPAISKYTLIYYGIVNNKTILFNFTCPANEKDTWQNTAHAIMNSIQIKKTL